jgi:AhpC/TSA family
VPRPESEDRFADLGPGRPADDTGEGGGADAPPRPGRSAAERFAELDEREPEPGPPPPPRPSRPAGRYTWVVGIAFVLALIVAGANALRHAGQGDRGILAGKRLPPFAAPLATSNHNNDVNLKRNPVGGKPAACEVRLAGVLNSCELTRRPLVLSFVANGGNGCDSQLDRVQRVARAFPQINFAGVISKTSLADAASSTRRHGWTFPVLLDRDAGLFNTYAIGDCPTTIFSHAGGISAGTRRSNLSEAQLRRYARALLRFPHRALPL